MCNDKPESESGIEIRRVDSLGNDLDSDRVYLVKRSVIGFGWCCAPKWMNAEQVQVAVDTQCEPYIPDLDGEGPAYWTVCPREHEDPTRVSPGHCAEHPDRQHWWLVGGVSGMFIMALTGDDDGVPDDLVIHTGPASNG